jgi:hypothetical protein
MARGAAIAADRFHTTWGAHIRPRPYQQPFPKFNLAVARGIAHVG